MSENIENMPVLPIGDMLRDADRAAAIAESNPGPDTLIGDLACHVRALVAELEKAAAACALAHNHLDHYGIVEGDDREKQLQEAVFEATGPFCRVVGHGFTPIYRNGEARTR